MNPFPLGWSPAWPGFLFSLSIAALPVSPSSARVEPAPTGLQPGATAPTDPTIEVSRLWGGRLLSSTHAFDAQGGEHLWVGEDGGRIRHGYRAQPTGAFAWETRFAPDCTHGAVLGIFALPQDPRLCWAVTDDGWVLGSDSSGDEWTALQRIFDDSTPARPALLHDIHFLDDLHGFVSGVRLTAGGSTSGLLATWDGGHSWNAEPLPAGATPVCYDMDFVRDPASDEFLGLVWEDGELGRLLFHQGDATQPWSFVHTTEDHCNGAVNHNFRDVEFSPESTLERAVAYAVTSQAQDCGHVYRGVFDATSQSSCPAPNSSWCWTAERHACEQPQPGESCRSTQPQLVTQNGCVRQGPGYEYFQALYGVHVVDSDTALAVGYASLHARTAASGPDWIDITDHQYFSSAPIFSVTGNGIDDAWIFGSFGDIRHVPDARSVTGFDAEHDYESVPPPRPYTNEGSQTANRLSGIFFLDAAHGWAVGQHAAIEKWDASHDTWRTVHHNCPQSGDPETNLFGIVMGNEIRGVAVGRPNPYLTPAGWPQIFVTRDGGDSWAQPGTYVGSTNGLALRAVDVRPPPSPSAGQVGKEYWAVGFGGSAVRVTVTGGAWTAESFPLPNGAADDLAGIAFLESNRDIAVAVGQTNASTGSVWRLDLSRLPANPWENVNLTSTPGLTDVASVGSRIWAVGNGPLGNSSTGTVLYCADFSAPMPALVPCSAAEAQTNGMDLSSVAAIEGPTGTEVLIGGLRGGLVRTVDESTNGTATWAVLDSHTRRNLKSVCLPQAGVARILGIAEKDSAIVTDSLMLEY